MVETFPAKHNNRRSVFPKEIDRIGKAKAADITGRFDLLQEEVAVLYKHAKNETGLGYLVKTTEKNFRRTGNHQLPESIAFETAEDYLHFTRKKSEWQLFNRNYELLIKALPQLKAWILENPLHLTLPGRDWTGIIAVCKYFISIKT
ncbi:DUF3322 domain-containing protein [Paraflavitalea speifideaquila]|uniref:DUF3322 domain-containing protein n=1 Tax=Paraflavitalea speifideaquila TaxID=3076558 RepID=UPI0028E2348E|nr:DUF3322 domain-containing protein [Paraflavitalea speifideiaquila]